MKKRIVYSMMLALLSLMLVATGCSTKGNAPSSTPGNVEGGTSSPDPGASETEGDEIDKYAPIDGKKYEFLWTFYQTEPLADDAILKKRWEDEFNVKLNVMNIDYKNYDQIMNLKVTGGEIPDRLRVQTNAQKINYYNQGITIGIPLEVARKYAPNMMQQLEEIVPADALESSSIRDGKLIAIPDLANPMFRNPIVWRGDWLEKVGITKVPETLEEFEDALYKFANNDPDRNSKKDTYGLSRSGFSVVFGAFGIPWDQASGGDGTANWQVKDGELVYSAIQPEAKEALALLAKWYKDGVIDPEFITGENTGGYWGLSHAFINGRVGFTSHGQTYHWAPTLEVGENKVGGQNTEEMKKLNPSAAEAILHGVAPIGPNGLRGVNANPIIKAEATMFGKNLENEPDKIGKLLQMLDFAYQSDDNWNTAQLGVKGEMWDYVDVEDVFGHTHKVAQLINEYTEWNGTNKLNANFGHVAMTVFSVPNQSTASYEWHEQIQGNKFHLSNALLSPLPSEAKYKAELIKIQEKAIISIITGEKPIDYFDTFVEEWRAAGGKQLEQEAAEWYAENK